MGKHEWFEFVQEWATVAWCNLCGTLRVTRPEGPEFFKVGNTYEGRPPRGQPVDPCCVDFGPTDRTLEAVRSELQQAVMASVQAPNPASKQAADRMVMELRAELAKMQRQG